jgi:cyclopropane-fatty-acyl-phospholipid synthase
MPPPDSSRRPQAGTDRERTAARALLQQLIAELQLPFALQLWDGSRLAAAASTPLPGAVAIAHPGVLRALLRRPTLETVARQWASGNLDLVETDLLSFVEAARARRVKLRTRGLRWGRALRRAWPLLFATPVPDPAARAFAGEATGRDPGARDEAAFVRFHYDVSNAFYRLFLDPELQYSCAYYTDWSNDLAQAQYDKLEMICRKLRLAPGEWLLDVGCGWGGLVCHAARHHGVYAHGVTLSESQHAYAQDKIAREGLGDRVTVELKDYRDLEGPYDKIASIGMYEHVGIANYPAYFGKLNALLRDRGILLNHGITRRAKRSRRRFARIRPENRLIRKYIFPGSELDHIGHTVAVMEAHGFEVHDVEGWREHYARTCRLWYGNLLAHADAAVAEVGPEVYRMWIAYLAGVAVSFEAGSLRIFQTVATKHKARGPSGMPPTRADLYRA